MNGKELATALRNGDHVYGTAILSPSAIWPEVVASVGLDFVFIDTEHTPLNRETVSNMCHVYSALNLAPVVRIPSPDPYQASMVLDGGAAGIIAPYIETPGQVRDLAEAVKLKPLKGIKVQDRRIFDDDPDPYLASYLKKNNAGKLLILNIESVPAIDALDEILAVEGIDGILVGPHDLSCSLGIPEQYDDPVFTEAVVTIIKKARQSGVGAGIHIFYESGFKQEKEWAAQGANLVVHSSDILAFKSTIQKEINSIKDFLGHEKGHTSDEAFKV
jgi:2-keto-3-deoxy-L-rhamnonate aldolase RhmA